MNIFKIVSDFIEQHKLVFSIGLISIFWIIACVVFKASPILNLPNNCMINFGEATLNIAYSVFAAVLFFFFCDYYNNIKRNEIKKKYFNENLKEVSSRIKIYIDILDKIKSGEVKDRSEFNNLIYCHICIETFITRSFELYQDIIPNDLFDAMNLIINSELFNYIYKRINGKLKGMTIKELIVYDKQKYDNLVNALKTVGRF